MFEKDFYSQRVRECAHARARESAYVYVCVRESDALSGVGATGRRSFIVYMYIYVHTCIYMYVHTHVYICMYTYIEELAYIHTCNIQVCERDTFSEREGGGQVEVTH